MHELVPFRHEDIRLREACWINGKPYFTRRAVGEWLEYADPVNAVSHLINRNSHIKPFSVVVKLSTTDGKSYDTEIYDPIGFQLIVFESRQPKARRYKIAVAHLVYAYMNGLLVPVIPQQPKHLLAYEEELRELSTLPFGHVSSAVRDVAEKTGKSPDTIRRWAKRLEEEGSLEYHYKKAWKKRREVYVDPVYECVLKAALQGKGNKEIAAEFCISLRTVQRIRQQGKES